MVVPPPSTSSFSRSIRCSLLHRSLPDLSQISLESSASPGNPSIEVEPLISIPGPSWKTKLLSPEEWKCSKVSLASSSSAPLCRICHLEATSARDPHISPCRCSGSLLFVHRSCLVHWLELSTRKMVPSPRCELCGYLYQRGGLLNVRGLHWPRLHLRDKLLNALFIVAFSVMLLCAVMSLHFLRVSEYHATIRGGYRVVSTSLTNDDVTVIICSILFFSAFFVAVFTQYRAEASIFRLFFRLWVINRNWTIKNYNILDDPEMLAVRQARGQLVRRLSPKRPAKTLLLSQ